MSRLASASASSRGVKWTHVLNTRNLNLETLALTHLLDDLADLGGAVKRRATGQGLPVVEDGLGEGLSRGGLAQVTVEAKGLHDGQVGLDGEQRSTGALLLTEDVTTSAGKDTVDTTHGLLGNLDLDQKDGLEKGGLGKQSGGVQDSAGGGDDLTTTTVDSIGVQGDIHDVPANGTHRLLGNGTLAGGPLETRDNGVLDFVEVLDGLGLVDEQVGASGVGAEGPDLTGVGDVPAEVIGQNAGTSLEVITGADLAGLDLLGELLVNGLSDHVDTVVLVGRLRQSSDAGLADNGLTVLDDGVGDDEGNTGVVVHQIVQANLQVELTGAGDNVFTRLGSHGQNARIGLGETLETLDELGEILSVLDLDGALDDGGDGELHDLEVVGGVGGGESSRLEQELVNADQTDNVTGRHVVDGLNLATHHQDGALNGLDEKVLLLAGGVVGALDADLDTRLDGTGEDTTEGVEAALVGGGDHLGDVKHERTLGVAVTDGNGSLVIGGTLVESLDTVLLGRDGGGEVENHHLQKGVGGGQESAHDGLEELLALLLTVLGGELEVELLKEGGDLLLLEVHDGGEDLEDGVQDELVEGTLELLALVGALGGPLLGVGVEVVVAPETLHHLVAVDTKLLGVADGELADGEGPAMQTGTEGDGTSVRVDLDITERLVEVGRDDNVDGLDSAREGLVEVLLGNLELEESTVDLVDDDDRLDALTESLTQDGLGLDAHTLDGVDDDKSTVRDTESGSDLGGEINVTRGVDQVDEEVGAVGLLASNVLNVLGVDVVVQGDGSRLDSNTTLLLVGTGIRRSRVSGLGGGDDTGLGQEGVGEGGLSVIDVGNDGHVTDVRGLVHEPTDLLNGEATMRPWLAMRTWVLGWRCRSRGLSPKLGA
ncbi:hypothetical protein CTA1_8343 [Colletotrichum tanaceti]|uniref:Uncharacterized protein n=1 Tax=Colletotrichum tanaceti TaxID=1306861 RepID=A0A4U6XQ24_9PEZI|nr:hypothetical protein CTA1_8343 [Colletotrichum tanaceti]